jgi:hypothetical protein
MPNLIKARFMSGSKTSRYLIGGFIALELLAIPAAAQIVQTVSFKIEPTVIASKVPLETAGRTDFVVISNAPFYITAANMIGDINVSVSVSGQVGELIFGQSAQLPGPASRCATVTSPAPTPIYQATQRTAAKRGETAEQAIIMTFTYDPVATPDFQFSTDDVAMVAAACDQIGSS